MSGMSSSEMLVRDKFRAQVITLIKAGTNRRVDIETALGLVNISHRLACMVKLGVLSSIDTGEFYKGRKLIIYSLGNGQSCWERPAPKPFKETPALLLAWPVSVPKTTVKPVVHKLIDKQINGRGQSCVVSSGIQSSMG